MTRFQLPSACFGIAVLLVAAALSIDTIQAQGLGGTPEQRAKQLAIEKTVPEMPITDEVLYLSIPGQTMGQTVGVSRNSKGHLFVYSRTGPGGVARGGTAAMLFEFDEANKFVKLWGPNNYAASFAHSVRVDKEDNVWMVDEGSGMIVKFDPSGMPRMQFGRTLEAIDCLEEFVERGEKIPEAERHPVGRTGIFNRPTDVTWDSKNNIYVTDGYGNSRVVKIAPGGHWLKTVGTYGSGKDQFIIPHGIAADSQDNIYVADRNNWRIQVYDSDLNYKKTYTGMGSPWSVCVTPGSPQYLFTGDGTTGKIYKMDMNGKLLGWAQTSLGQGEDDAGRLIHQIHCESANVVYKGSAILWQVEKITIKNSDIEDIMHVKRACFVAVFSTVCIGRATAQTADELINDGRNTDNVTTQSMGYDRKNYSPLAQINRSNVKRLVPVWTTSLMNDAGELSAPTIYNGVIYVVNGKWSFAIDVETGRQIWRTPVDVQPEVQRVALFGAINRGAATIYDGKLFRVTVDDHLIALDMKTGKELWNQTFADFHEGYTSTGAPIVANGVLISGMAGGEFTTRGFLDGWDPDTGRKLWRRYTIPAPGEPGSETWPKDGAAWTQGGGATWRSGSYDPQLDLVYWGTGNAEPYDPRPRGALDSLYTSSVIAIRPKTGELVCHFQYTPNDVYDVDAVDEQVLADLRVGGQIRKVMIQANKNGFLYVLDRTNCSLIAAHPYTTVNWASHVDPATGRPVLTDLYQRFLAGEEVQIYPQRGTNAVPIAFDPNTGLVFISAWDMPRIQKLAPPKQQVIGTNSTGVVGRVPAFKPGDVVGHFVAIDPLTGEKKWTQPLADMASSAGMLTTGGGLVFTGKLTGEFVALDAATGETLWQFKTGSSVNATAITYTYKQRQYVTVLSGLGGALARRFAASSVPTGGAVWTFALMPD